MKTTENSPVLTTSARDAEFPISPWPPDSPRGGEFYSSPVPVSGRGAYNGAAGMELFFNPWGPQTVVLTPNYNYSTSQALEGGPNALHYKFTYSSGGGGQTPTYDTGWFYVLTPPE
ncbi:hypothetical protein [Pseudomonas sp. PD9R]|uniref:hypothetical protein n=1 Tax=Pseudomonas sp. PD9R TaxID=2853534 RepID=UPI001C4898E8|nr:hypothetical protein [Pseudomonas sp. PD9R]MBV6825217.1 hypothetical protein [Pseudomonas sp. PD9R]